MSTVESSVMSSQMSSQAGDAPPGGEKGSKKMVFIGLGAVLFLGVAGALLYVMVGGSAGQETNEVSEESSGPSGPPGPGTGGGPPPSVPDDPGYVPAPPEPETPTTPIPPSPTPPPTSRNMKKNPFMCSVGPYALQAISYPADGICDIIFYLHVTVSDKSVVSTDSPDSFNLFKTKAAAAKKTEYGISFHANWANNSNEALDTAAKMKKLKDLISQNIVHHGVLNIDGQAQRRKRFSQGIETLMTKINNLHAINHLDDKFIVVGSKLNRYNDTNERVSYGQDLLKYTKFGANVILVNTALSSWMTLDPCRNYPPTLWQGDTGGVVPTFDAAITLVKNANIPEDVVVVFAFTMGVKLYRMFSNFTALQKAGQTCAYETTVTFRQICEPMMKAESDKAQELQKYIAYAAGNVNMRLSMTWDTGKTMEKKMKKTFSQLPDRKNVGFMLFDVDFEEPSQQCSTEGTGAHPRINYLLKYIDTLGP